MTTEADTELNSRWLAGRKVLVEGDCKRRHLKVYSDGPGHWYVRIGKRGTVREYLTTARCEFGLVWVFGYEG